MTRLLLAGILVVPLGLAGCDSVRLPYTDGEWNCDFGPSSDPTSVTLVTSCFFM